MKSGMFQFSILFHSFISDQNELLKADVEGEDCGRDDNGKIGPARA